MLISLDITTLGSFAVGATLASIGVVHVTGYIGAKGDNLALTGLNAGLTVALIVLTALIALQGINWSIAVVIAGSAFLIAPFLVQPLPERFRDGLAGLIVFAILALGGLVACAMTLWT